jgi:hypothetical protein
MWENSGMENLMSAFADSAAALSALNPDSEALAGLDDDGVLGAMALVVAHRRHLDIYATAIAGELAVRSRRELGQSGLAQRQGFVNPEALLQSVSQVSRAEATKLVRIGVIMAGASPGADEGGDRGSGNWPPEGDAPWQSAIVAAIARGAVSTDAAEAIRRGLGDADAAVTPAALGAAFEELLGQAGSVTVDQLLRRARQLRDGLDADGVARRQKQQRDDRCVKRWIRDDGMYAVWAVLDPEDGRAVFAAFDHLLSPRRGGPRFVDPVERARAEAILEDPRTDVQLAADALVAMVRLAVDADPGTLFGRHRPAVRVLVTDGTMRAQAGRGHLEGGTDPVAYETISRYICDNGLIGVEFDDDGQCVNVGRDNRLFTERQRVGLAARDGGCRFPGCDRPPSWCEAHHIRHWHRDHGKTDIADGILLCRFHHMLVHNNHWQILRDRGS